MVYRWRTMEPPRGERFQRPLIPFVCAICEDEQNTDKYPWAMSKRPGFRNDPPVCRMCAGRWGNTLGFLKPLCGPRDQEVLRIIMALANAIEWEAREQKRRGRRGEGLPERPGERRARIERDRERARPGLRRIEIWPDEYCASDGERGPGEASIQRGASLPDGGPPLVRLREGRNPRSGAA